ncbi:MAG: hypothetical protein KH321_03085 [Clostridium sp.]|jgi:hypothetical protein|nr:hypothetical protein [Clostridium sp.]
MWLGISTAIEAFFKSLSSGFDYASTSKEHQSETQIIKDKKRLKKATDIAEKIISLVYKYLDCFDEKDRKKFIKLHDDFKDNN